MSERNKIIDLRPAIPTIMDAQISSRAEQFQNRSLRPILKFQNDLLLEVFRHYVEKRKGVFTQLSKPKQLTYIASSIQKDQQFKHSLLGIIVGQFTLEEWGIYKSEEKELSRRITNLLIQRLQDQLEVLRANASNL